MICPVTVVRGGGSAQKNKKRPAKERALVSEKRRKGATSVVAIRNRKYLRGTVVIPYHGYVQSVSHLAQHNREHKT